MVYIEASDISFGYTKNKRIISNLNLKINREDVTILMGHNGGGKTTLGKLLCGILKPQAGEIIIDGTSSKELSLGQIGKKIGYLFQNPSCQLFAASVEEEICFPMRLRGEPEEKIKAVCDEILDFFELTSLKEALPINLSHGEKQRLALAAILVNKPEFLILDEPTTGLDKLRKEKLSYYIKELYAKGIGMIIISHDKEFIDLHGTIKIELARGEIVADGE